MDPDPDPGGPKTYESGTATLLHTVIADPHQGDVDPDPDSSFHFGADPDPTFSI
jgi:hypothetical protein